MAHRAPLSFLFFCSAFPETLSSAPTSDLRLETPPLTRFQVECMLFCIGDNAFAGYLPLESANCAFNTFVIVNLYSCHSKTSKFLPSIMRAAITTAATAAGAASSLPTTAATTTSIGFSRLAAGFASFRLAHTSLLEKLLFAR